MKKTIYQKRNDWTILKSELDRKMLDTSARTNIKDCDWHDDFVPHLSNQYWKKSGRNKTAIDIGASYGWMSVGFAKHFKEVNCFEVREDVRYALELNVKSFSNINVFDCGLSSTSTDVLLSESMRTGTTRIGNYPNSSLTGTVHPLDSFKFKDVDLIKIDVEWHELEVLIGAKETIEKYKPLLVVETHCSRGYDNFLHRQRVFKFLKDMDYQIDDIRLNDIIYTHISEIPFVHIGEKNES